MLTIEVATRGEEKKKTDLPFHFHSSSLPFQYLLWEPSFLMLSCFLWFGEVSDKSTKSAARNITREHVWIIICAIKERWVWTKYFDSCSTSEAISVFLFAFVPFQRRHVAPFSLEAWSRREFIEKVIEGWYMGHFLIIGQTIGIDLTLAQIISDFKELSSTLSFSKF